MQVSRYGVRIKNWLSAVGLTLGLAFMLSTGLEANEMTKASAMPFQNFAQFGANPGELKASIIHGEMGEAVVVLLHGCGQDAQLFAEQSGFSAAAAQLGFTLLLPQQTRQNNPQLCFNWFSAIDQRGEAGESQSIANMVAALKTRQNTEQVFIAGLSAGGAMASNLITTLPDMFDAGAVVSGIGYPCADGLVKAISCMKNGPAEPVVHMAKLIQGQVAANKLPDLVVITGLNDAIVNPINGRQLALTWALVTRAEPQTTEMQLADNLTHFQWLNPKTQQQIHHYQYQTLGHGWPVSPGNQHAESSGAFLLSHLISATQILLKHWKLI